MFLIVWLRSLMALAVVVVGGAGAASAAGRTGGVAVARGGVADFSQVTTSRGSLRSSRTTTYGGRRAYVARYCGGPGNGYSRGVAHVDWAPGATRSYGVALLLPRSFAAAQQGEIDLLRWDNYPLFGRAGDYGGVVLFDGDGRGHLERGTYAGASDQLGRSFSLPRGRWFWLEVRQRLSAGPDATSVVRIDGRVVARTHRPNSYDRPVRRVRFGLVAIDERRQIRPVALAFARPTTGRADAGPASAGSRLAAPAPAATLRRTPTPERVPSRCSR